MHHYLTNYKLFVGLCGTFTHVSDGIEFDNKKQLAAPDDISIATIQSDALSMFRNTGDEYIGKGFTKPACLQKKYAGTSQIEVVMVLFDFFQECSQGDKTPNEYDADRRGLFDQVDAISNHLSRSFRVMFMVHGLNEE